MNNAISIISIYLAAFFGSPAMATIPSSVYDTVALEYDELATPREGRNARVSAKQHKVVIFILRNLPVNTTDAPARPAQNCCRFLTVSLPILYRNLRT